MSSCYKNAKRFKELIMYRERYLDCNWSISVRLIPKRRAKICSNGAKICKNRAKSVKTVQNSVTTEEPVKFDLGKWEC